MSDRTAHLVLDTSGIASFLAGGISVGELLVEVDAANGAVLLPYPCLVEAAAAVPDKTASALLGVLLDHAAVQLVDVAPEWQILAALVGLIGQYGAASAAWLAATEDVDIATRRPGLYAPLGEDIVLLLAD